MPASGKPEFTYVLDTSAILTYLLDEPEAARVASLHRHAAVPFIAISELYAALWLRFGQAKADQVVAAVKDWRLPWLWPTEETLCLAGRLRAVYRLGLADGFIVALAFIHQLILVTKDHDFRSLQPDLKIIFL